VTIDPHAPTPLHSAVLPPRIVCPHCGKPLPEIARPAEGHEALVSKAPSRLAETVRIAKDQGAS
jgi:hypothetical protein